MTASRIAVSRIAATLLLAMCIPLCGSAKKPKSKKKELPPVEHHDYRVEGGVITTVSPVVLTDTVTRTVVVPVDSVAADSLDKVLSPRAQRRLERAMEDSTNTRYSPIFRDTMPISRMCFISCAVPGFGQLHNKQYWKIPLAYATLGGAIYGFTRENKPYQDYKRQYDDLMARGVTDRSVIDPVQTKMIRSNTRRQLLMAGIYASWVYFVCDAAVNYPGTTSSIKKATTLSTILPGAGQIYNRSYWKVPIVLGGFATMACVIDWNNRGYKRFQTAYNLRIDGDPDTKDEFTINGSQISDDNLRSYRDSYRRARDLAIILTAGLYLLNIIDAHVDAQMKTYDISDDLTMNLEPSLMNFYSMRASYTNMPALTFSIKF